MKLILSDKYLDMKERKDFSKGLGENFQEQNLDGCSYREIERIIQKQEDKIYVTADEKFLMLHPRYIQKENIFLLSEGKIRNIQDCTSKELRNAHNLFKMYVAGAFE